MIDSQQNISKDELQSFGRELWDYMNSTIGKLIDRLPEHFNEDNLGEVFFNFVKCDTRTIQLITSQIEQSKNSFDENGELIPGFEYDHNLGDKAKGIVYDFYKHLVYKGVPVNNDSNFVQRFHPEF